MAPTIVKKKILCTMIIALCLKKKKKKRIWCKDWLMKRNIYGSTTTILHELQNNQEHDFRNYLRMSVSTFYILLSKVEPYIVKKRHNYEKQHYIRSSSGSNSVIFSKWVYLFGVAVQYTHIKAKLVPHNTRNM